MSFEEPVFAFINGKTCGRDFQRVFIGPSLEAIAESTRGSGVEQESAPKKIDLPWYDVLGKIANNLCISSTDFKKDIFLYLGGAQKTPYLLHSTYDLLFNQNKEKDL